MGRTGNIIIEDFRRQICVPLENSAYFCDGDGVDSNPDWVPQNTPGWCYKCFCGTGPLIGILLEP